MTNIIRETFNSEIHFYSNKEFYIHENGVEIVEKELKDTLNSNQTELFTTYKVTRCNYENEIAFINFEKGYKTASKLIIESLK